MDRLFPFPWRDLLFSFYLGHATKKHWKIQFPEDALYHPSVATKSGCGTAHERLERGNLKYDCEIFLTQVRHGQKGQSN